MWVAGEGKGWEKTRGRRGNLVAAEDGRGGKNEGRNRVASCERREEGHTRVSGGGDGSTDAVAGAEGPGLGMAPACRGLV